MLVKRQVPSYFMKVTNRNARQDRAGKHNDRNFNLDNAPHIDKNKLEQNKYWTYNGDTNRSFAELELEFYEQHFSDYLEERNRKNAQARHADRVISMEDYYKGKNTRPEDKILQIGDIKEHATGEELWECALEYINRFDQIYGDKCKILDMALHLDEATPHVHIRRVWLAENENGHEYIGQNAALEQLGVTAPDPDAPINKYNNSKITFTRSDISLFQDICIEKGFNIEKNVTSKREHLDTLVYKKQQIIKEIEELELTRKNLGENVEEVKKEIQSLDNTINNLFDYFENNPFFDGRYDLELAEARKKNKLEQLMTLTRIYNKEIAAVARQKSYEKSIEVAASSPQVRRLEKFISKEGLTEKYLEETKKEREQEISRSQK